MSESTPSTRRYAAAARAICSVRVKLGRSPEMAARDRDGSLMPWLGIALVVILADQFTKTLILSDFQLNETRAVTSFFNVVRWHNTGAAFSFLAGAAGWQRWFFIGLGAVATVFILWLLKRHAGQ